MIPKLEQGDLRWSRVDGLKEGSPEVHMVWGGPGVCGTVDNALWVLPGSYEIDFLQVINNSSQNICLLYTLPLLILGRFVFSCLYQCLHTAIAHNPSTSVHMIVSVCPIHLSNPSYKTTSIYIPLIQKTR